MRIDRSLLAQHLRENGRGTEAIQNAYDEVRAITGGCCIGMTDRDTYAADRRAPAPVEFECDHLTVDCNCDDETVKTCEYCGAQYKPSARIGEQSAYDPTGKPWCLSCETLEDKARLTNALKAFRD